MKTLKKYVLAVGSKKYSSLQWDEAVTTICDLFESTTPKALLEQKDVQYSEIDNKQKLAFNQEACFTMCIT